MKTLSNYDYKLLTDKLPIILNAVNPDSGDLKLLNALRQITKLNKKMKLKVDT
jgi:hypothetical protein